VIVIGGRVVVAVASVGVVVVVVVVGEVTKLVELKQSPSWP